MGVEAVVVGQLVDREAEQSLHQDHPAETGQRAPPGRGPAAGHRDPERDEQADLKGRQDRPRALVVGEGVARVAGEALQPPAAPPTTAPRTGAATNAATAPAPIARHPRAAPRRAAPTVQNAAAATSRTATSVCEKACMAVTYDPTTAAGTASTSRRETPRAKKTAGVASSIAVRRFQPRGAASAPAR